MTWEEAEEQFEEYLLASGYALRTIEEYLREIRECEAFLPGSLPGTITKENLVEYQTHLCIKKPALSSSTLVKKLAALRTFFSFLTKEQICLVDPAATLPVPKAPRPLPRGILSVREVMRLLATPDVGTPFGLRNRAILELLYSSGIRNSELRFLRVSDVDLNRMEITVLGKGSKVRIVPLGEEAAYWIEQYLLHIRPLWAKADPAVFLNPEGRAMTRGMVSEWVKCLARKAKIKTPISAHSLRHTCATHLLRNKADLRSIQELLGHKLLSTTQRYTKVEISDLKAMHKRCHPRGKRRQP